MWMRLIVYKILHKLASFFNPEKECKDSMWSGDYQSWEEAEKLCGGYDSDLILNKCAESVLKVKYGEAVYERDSYLFNHIEYSWGLLAGLQKAALEHDGKLNIIDFGGSLGSTYFQNREFLGSMKEFTWNIVEQANFVRFGQKQIQDENLNFFFTIEECLSYNQANVLILSNVIQYLENPYEWVDKFTSLGFSYIIIDRTAFNKKGREFLTIQNVPKEIYRASYPAWFLNEEKLKKYFLKSYSLVADFESSFEEPMSVCLDLHAFWNGYIFKKNDII